MKKILVILTVMLLAGSVMAMPPPASGGKFSQAGLWGTVPYEAENPVAFVVTGGYGDAFQLDAGFAIPLSGNFYGFLSAMGGDHGGSLNGKVAYLFTPTTSSGAYGGLALGPEVSLENIPNDNLPMMAYIVGAAGFIGGYSFENWGLFGQVERNFSLETNAFVNSYTFRLGAYINL